MFWSFIKQWFHFPMNRKEVNRSSKPNQQIRWQQLYLHLLRKSPKKAQVVLISSPHKCKMPRELCLDDLLTVSDKTFTQPLSTHSTSESFSWEKDIICTDATSTIKEWLSACRNKDLNPGHTVPGRVGPQMKGLSWGDDVEPLIVGLAFPKRWYLTMFQNKLIKEIYMNTECRSLSEALK
jgi:hypothetical protein